MVGGSGGGVGCFSSLHAPKKLKLLAEFLTAMRLLNTLIVENSVKMVPFVRQRSHKVHNQPKRKS